MKVRRVPTQITELSAWIPVSNRVFEVEGMYEATCRRLKMMLVLTARDRLRRKLYLLEVGPITKQAPIEYFIRDLTALVISAKVDVLNPQVIKSRPGRVLTTPSILC